MRSTNNIKSRSRRLNKKTFDAYEVLKISFNN